MLNGNSFVIIMFTKYVKKRAPDQGAPPKTMNNPP